MNPALHLSPSNTSNPIQAAKVAKFVALAFLIGGAWVIDGQWALGSLDDISTYWRIPTSTTTRVTGRGLEAALDRLAQLGLNPWGRRLPDPVDCCF